MTRRDFASYYTDAKVAELQAAFNLVAPSPNWKTAIDAVVLSPSRELLENVLEAITFYTGSVATVTLHADGNVRVQAAGYYAAIGA